MINNDQQQQQQQSSKWGFMKSKRSASANPSTTPSQPSQAPPPKSPPLLTASPPAASSSRRSASGDFDPALREEWAALFDKTFTDFGSSDNSKLIFSNTQSHSRIASDPVNNSPTQLTNKIPPPLDKGIEKSLPQSRTNSGLPAVSRVKEDGSVKRSSLPDPPRRQDQQRQLLLQQQQMQEQRRAQIEQERRAQMEQQQQRRAIEHERQRQLQIQQAQERQRQIQLQDQEHERQRQLQIQEEQEKQRELQMQQEQERQRQLKIQQEQERHRQWQLQIQQAQERQRQIQLQDQEQETQRRLQIQEEQEKQRQKQTQQEQERQRQLQEQERQRQLTMEQEQQRQRQMQQQAEQQRQLMMQHQQQDQLRLRQQSAPVQGQAPVPAPFPTPVISAPSTPPTPPKQGVTSDDLPPRAPGVPAAFFNPSAGPQQFPPPEYAHRSSTSSPPRATTPELRRDSSWSPFGFGKSGQPVTNGNPGNFPPVAPRKSTDSNSSKRGPFLKGTRSLTDIKQGPDFGQQPVAGPPMPKSALVQRPPAPKGTTSTGVDYTTRLATGVATPEVGIDSISSTRARANAALELMEMRNPEPHKSIAAQRRERQILRKATPSVISTHSVDESVKARILATVMPNARISFVRGRDGMLQIVCPDSEVVRIGTGHETEPAPPTPPAMNAVAGVMGAAGYQGYFDAATGQIMVARINETIVEEDEKEWDEASTTPIEEAPPGSGFVTDRQYNAVYDAMGQFVGFQIAEIGVGTEPVPRQAYNTASQTDPMEGFEEIGVGVDKADFEIQTDAVEVGEFGVGVETAEVEVQSDGLETQEVATEGVQRCEIEVQTDDVAVGEVCSGLDKEEAGLQTERWETKEVGTEGVQTQEVGVETGSEVKSAASNEVSAVDVGTDSREVDVTNFVETERVVEERIGSPEALVDSEQSIEPVPVDAKVGVFEEVVQKAVDVGQMTCVEEGTNDVSAVVEHSSIAENETDVATVVEQTEEVAVEVVYATVQQDAQPTESQQDLTISQVPSNEAVEQASSQRTKDDEVVVIAEEEVIEPRATLSRTLHRSKSVSSPRRRAAPSAVQPLSIPSNDFKAQNRSSKSATTTGAQLYRSGSVKARKAEIEEAQQDAELLEKLKRRPSIGALAAVGEGKVLPGVLNLEVENPTYPQVLEFWTEVATKKPEPKTPVVTEAKEV
ncbi:hypothetical protein BJ742DRAFT_854758 [Cladochytrium replicatum]|nr:hypothetical protein BJ742DRAFT_854758 [Cladochytrium replicatum]